MALLQHMCACGTLPVIALQMFVHTGSSGEWHLTAHG
jgi:hypothetical protein